MTRPSLPIGRLHGELHTLRRLLIAEGGWPEHGVQVWRRRLRIAQERLDAREPLTVEDLLALDLEDALEADRARRRAA